MSTHLADFVIVTVLAVVRLNLWQLPGLPIMLMPVVDQVANSNQATFVANQNVWQSSSEDQCVENVLVVGPMQAHQPSLHYHGEGQYSTCYRWQVDGLFAARCSPDFLRLSFTSPPIGLVGNIWTSVQSPSIKPTMHGIRNQKNHSSMFLRESWYK